MTNTATIASGGLLAAATPAEKRVFWAAWSGWMLDGFDLSIYFFVLVPALKELLQLSGHEPTPANIALYGGYLFTAFMVGWASSMFWGWLADRVGRVKVLCLTILTYSVCTALCGFSTGILMFAIFRFLSGFGVGGEWAAGTPLLQESVPEHIRAKWAGWLHTAIPIGMMLAAAASLLLPIIGWRGRPAPSCWGASASSTGRPSGSCSSTGRTGRQSPSWRPSGSAASTPTSSGPRPCRMSRHRSQ